ncbi:hypothetical protein CC86DRAFT_398715 [Ophiobolus disseminans]|uniref:Uncharacterized protein n=1 Tax=Ophiobolus disseminans TaxID=1469910 RepID=A0A6A6ZE98_9PLEO|nr:hypothetical protein CC86DRAFT_398715 [Ophiobolus disseminans]
MLTTVLPILAAFFLRSGLTSPYPFTNTTTSIKRTNTNTNSSLPTNVTIPQYRCQTAYPSDLTIVNQRYPNHNTSHLHSANSFFMLRRELRSAGEIATRVQFDSLPPNATHTTCRLEFVLPHEASQRIAGSNPTFNIYQVERAAGAIATWNTYQASAGAALFGRVNGEPEALERTREVGGVAAINETRCNETLTFEMGMAFDGLGGVPNY